MSENVFPASFTRGAFVFRKLRELGPGKAMKIAREDLADCDFPCNPLDRQDEKYKIEWLRSRMPFPCMVHTDIISGDTIFERPKLESPPIRLG